MSASKIQSPSQSPTPSKSSLRRTSGVQNTSQRSLLPAPSPRFEDAATTEVRYSPRSPPNQTLEYDSNEDDDDDEGIEDEGPDALLQQHARELFEHHEGSYFPSVTAQELLHPFEPLFTLIEDDLTSEHHHPSIHYIFADDDHEIITEAAIRSLDEDDVGSLSQATQAKATAGSQELPRGQLPPPQPGVREHYLILDVQPSVDTQLPSASRQSQHQSISRAQPDESLQQSNPQPQPSMPVPPFVVSSFTSLSPDWQIHTATITSAPTMSEAPDGEDEGFMLRIQGRGFPLPGTSDLLPPNAKKGKGKATGGSTDEGDTAAVHGLDNENLEELIERLQHNIRDIRKLIEVELPAAVPTVDVHSAEDIQPDDKGPQETYDLDEQD